MAIDENFVKIIVTFPDLIMIGWDDNLAEVFNTLLGIAEPVGFFTIRHLNLETTMFVNYKFHRNR